ncbi:MAG: O-antigen ligase family protein [Bacteroidota bacterium]|nr:O-antigen ligase family protein [Bacteroidota bacterium]
MITKKHITGLAFVLLFIVANTILMLHEIYWLNLLPFVLLIAYSFFYFPEKLLYFLIFITPLSFIYKFEDFGISVSIPTEPIILTLMILFFLRYFIKGDYDKKILKHPISIAIYINLSWILITSVTSTMPLISLKFFLSRLWFVTVFYFMIINLFKSEKSIKNFFWLFLTPLIFVIIFTIYKHHHFFFSHDYANKVTYPFFKDHTIYGAVIAMFLPVIGGFFVKNKILKLNKFQNAFALIITIILIAGVSLSYSRAAWISIVVAISFPLLFWLKIKFRGLILILLISGFSIFIFWSQIIQPLRKNTSVSSTDVSEQVKSISNISTDASNAERINRWNCAIRMFKEKPLFGWGPGTYMFKYAPFQLAKERTIISTDFGNLGNAHSEYLGPLSESGFLGMLSFLLLAFTVLYTGMKVYYKNNSSSFTKVMTILLLMGFVTYLTHGILNNFLQTDKASVPFWGFIAIITAMDIYFNKQQKLEKL